MGDDTPDISPETEGLAVDHHMGIAHSDQFVETEKFGLHAVGFEGVEHRILRGPELQSGSVKGVADGAVFKGLFLQQGGGENFTASGSHGTVGDSFGTVAKKQICGAGSVDIDSAHKNNSCFVKTLKKTTST